MLMFISELFNLSLPEWWRHITRITVCMLRDATFASLEQMRKSAEIAAPCGRTSNSVNV